MLLTSRQAPGEIDITLPDLRSRLRALPLLRIEPPDEGLLKAVLVKLFADRQLDGRAARRRLSGAAHGAVDGGGQPGRRGDRPAVAAPSSAAVTRAIAAEALASLGVRSDGD